MKTTNAMRLLTAAGIPFRAAEYAFDVNDLDGHHAAEGIGMPYDQVYKTLVTQAPDAPGELYVFCLPVNAELDLKKAAVSVKKKRLEMLPLRDLFPRTGYIRGGCSPIGMKKEYPVRIEETAQLFDIVAVSAGERGVQLLLDPVDLCRFVKGDFADIIH